MTANPLSPLSSAAPGPATPAGARFAAIDPLRFLRQHLLLLLCTVVVGAGLGVGLHYFLLHKFPTWTSSAQLLAKANDNRDDWWRGNVGTGIPTVGQDTMSLIIQNQIKRILSDQVISDALQIPEIGRTAWFRNLGGDTDPDSARFRAKEKLLKDGQLTADHIRGSSIILVSAHGPDDDDLQVILNAVITTYLRKLQADLDADANQRRRVYTDVLKRADDDRRNQEEQLAKFVQQNDVAAIESSVNHLNTEYQDFSRKRVEIQSSLVSILKEYQRQDEARKSGTWTPTDEDLNDVRRDPAISTREERIRLLREERSVLVDRFGEQHRQVKDVDLRIAATKTELDRETERALKAQAAVKLERLQNAAGSFQAQLQDMEKSMAAVETRMKDLSAKLLDYRRFQDAIREAKEKAVRAEGALTAEHVKSSSPEAVPVSLIQRATQPEVTFPYKLYVDVPLVTLLVLLLVGGLTFLKDSVDQRIKSPADIRLLPGLQLLGVVPAASEDPSGRGGPIEGVVQRDPAGLLAESFRQVRTSLLSRLEPRGYKTLLLVSAAPESGVSNVAGNLALSLAYNGKRVLLIDANFRRPAQHRLLGVRAAPGLVEILRGAAAVEDAIVRRSDPDFDVLPVGDAVHAVPELLEGSAFRGLLSQLESRYDLILIDAAPALVAGDSQVLVKHVDAVALVTRANVEKRGLLTRTARQLAGQRADLLGVILNGARSSAGGYYRANFEEFYRYQQNNGAAARTPDKVGAA